MSFVCLTQLSVLAIRLESSMHSYGQVILLNPSLRFLSVFLLMLYTQYPVCRGVVVKHAESQQRGCHFDSSMRHNKNAIGKDANGKPPHEFHFPRKNSEPRLWFLLRSKSIIRRKKPNMQRTILDTGKFVFFFEQCSVFLRDVTRPRDPYVCRSHRKPVTVLTLN